MLGSKKKMVLGFVLLGVLYLATLLPLYWLVFRVTGKLLKINWGAMVREEIQGQVKSFADKIKGSQQVIVKGESTFKNLDEEE